MVPLPQTTTTALERPRGILDLPIAELQSWLQEHAQPPLRARQIRRWILISGVESFDQMTDLPKGLRQELAAAFLPLATRIDQHLRSADDTHKLLLELRDGRRIECVLIQEAGRRTACISTQVGCGMGCVFCASGLGGVERNLTAAEMLEQLVRLRNAAAAQKGESRRQKAEGTNQQLPNDLPSAFCLLPSAPRLSHIVVMGMGEPLANLQALFEALDVATAKDGLGIGARHITISTVGLPAKIRTFAQLGKQYHLAVSLHAPNDALRSQIVPTHAAASLATILEAADFFYQTTGRQVTFEYVMLRGINDDISHARELAQLLRGRQAHVNVIPFNDVEGLPYQRPTPDKLDVFTALLRQHGISVKVRKRKGSEIDAACGQLRRRVEQQKPEGRKQKAEGSQQRTEDSIQPTGH
jgi:23S rRNA (adenine2503-C2)-methyltransferase